MEKISVRACKRRALEILKGKWKMMLAIMLIVMACTDYLPGILAWFIEKMDAENIAAWRQISSGVYTQEELSAGVVLATFPGSLLLIPLVSLIAGIFSPMLLYGIERICAGLIDGEAPRAGQLFRWKMLGKAWLMNFARTGLTTLAALGMIIGGMLFAAILGAGLAAPAIILIGIAAMFPVTAMFLRWSMAEYIWTENENFGPMEALHESAHRMHGHKWTAFLLGLSFFGWIFLSFGLSYGINFILSLLFGGEAPSMLADAIFILMMLPVSVYINMTHVVFYREISSRCEKGIPEDELENETDDEDDEAEPAALPQTEAPADLLPMTADEAAAYDLFARHSFSKKHMEAKGVLADYQKLNVSPVTEARWERSHVDRLAEKYAEEPITLNGILAVAAEYGSTYALDAAMNLVNQSILRSGADHSGSLLIQCHSLLQVLSSPAFADIPAVVSQKQARIEDMIRRLEQNA